MLTMDIGSVILMTASLSFLGLGAKPPTPELGAMISSGRLFFREKWWAPTFPGLTIFVMVLGANLLGDALRDILDPRMRGY
jgi:peptide/nickel transport system permease protein